MSEVANKIFPLIIFNYAQRKLGIDMFGYGQFGIYIIDLVLPIVSWGYNTSSSIAISDRQKAKQSFDSIITSSMLLRLMHAIVATVLMISLVNFCPAYRPYASGLLLIFHVIFIQYRYELCFSRDTKTLYVKHIFYCR